MPRSVDIPSHSVRQSTTHTVENRTDSLALILVEHLSKQVGAQMPTVNSLAAAVNVSPSHLRHIFKRKIGVSFGRYVKGLRLRRARQLLQETFWTVKQVMSHVGVSDHSHFAKDYKKEFGESPTQTRWRSVLAGKKITSCEPQNSHSGHKQSLAPQASHGSLSVRKAMNCKNGNSL